MKILLDECVDRRCAFELPGLDDVRTVPQEGWAGIKNGELMRLAETDFDVFITVDRNLSYQQNIESFAIALIVLKGRSNRIADLKPLAAPVIAKLPSVAHGTVTLISL